MIYEKRVRKDKNLESLFFGGDGGKKVVAKSCFGEIYISVQMTFEKMLDLFSRRCFYGFDPMVNHHELHHHLGDYVWFTFSKHGKIANPRNWTTSKSLQ